MNACETHAQRQLIVDAIIAGESQRSIAARINPQLSQATIGRFKLKVLKLAVSNLRPHGVNSNAVKEIADANPNIATEQPASNAHSDRLRNEIQGRVAARLERREGWISQAEKRPLIDKDGNVFNDMDHRALAAHDKNEGSDLTFLAELGGLVGGQQTSVNVQIAVLMPNGGNVPQATDVIDV